MEISRRNFLGAMGAMGALGAMGVMTGCAPTSANAQDDVEGGEGGSTEVILSDGTVWKGTPEDIVALGGSTMPLEELNRRRKEYVDSQTEWVNEDGSVVPVAYVKMRALIHTHGFGAGEGLNDTMFKRLQMLFTEEQVEAFLEMPWGVEFTANEFYAKSQKEGSPRTYEECKEICEVFSKAGFLPFRTRAEGITYNIPGFSEGVNTYSYCDEYYADPDSFDWPIGGSGVEFDHAYCGTPVFYSVPLNKEVVAEGDELLAYDDVEAVIKDHDYIAVQPCSCRYYPYVLECHEKGEKFPTFVDFARGDQSEFRDSNGDRIETCFALGDDAEYLVSLGLARRISQEEALETLAKSREDGFILHCLYGKEHAWICQCNPKVCGITAQWAAGAEALGGWEELEKLPTFTHRSHYELEVELSTCIKCGTCADRCPMNAIEMDDGPVVTDHLCMRCGQCAYVCPQKARKLGKRPDDEILEMPHLMIDDYNLKAAYRFEQGYIGKPNDGVNTKI